MSEEPTKLTSQGEPKWKRATPGIVACIVAAIFLRCTWPALVSVALDGDDVMNVNFAWIPPFWRFFFSNFVPFTDFYRPSGAAYYRLCFDIFGFHSGAFRAVTFAFLFANILLVYLVCRRLTGSSEMGVLASLLFCFHSQFAQFYMSNGTVYDAICTTFYLLAVWWYVRLRQERAKWRWWEWVVLYALFTAALNAKEMAATLPAMFALYEWLYDGPQSFRPRVLARWMWRHAPVAAIALALAVLALWGKTQPGSVMYGHPMYTPEYSLSRVFRNERVLLADLVYTTNVGLSNVQMVLIYVGLFAGAAISRKRCLWFFAWFALLAPLPVLFVPYRGFFVMYLPYVAWAMYGGSVLVIAREWLWRVVWKRPALAADAWEPERVFLFLAVALFVFHERGLSIPFMRPKDQSQALIAQTRKDVLALREPLPAGARIFLKRSRFAEWGWEPLQILRLSYHDRILWVDRPGMIESQPDAAMLAGYDRVMDFDGQKLVVVQRGNAAGAAGRALEYPR